ncbi:CPBP family intramembrane glutamic endopeptidase [Opitutus terrae]|uniref:CPBP family intramembrane glutamic endopeptidase n=1 Tax=Opitutus terrae TaxID=107709 RepID=UPI0011D09A45|nr:CPBP family intramembrane glutamic endopeptidase [Opitutus terrae]
MSSIAALPTVALVAANDSYWLTGRRAALITLQLVLLQLGFGIVLGMGLAFWNLANGLPSNTGTNHPLALMLSNGSAYALVIWRECRRSRCTLVVPATPQFSPALLLAPMSLLVAGAAIGLSDLENVTHALAPQPEWLRHYFGQLTSMAAHPYFALFFVAVFAPITEEILFRGLLLRGLLVTSTPVRAIAISSLLFAAMHLNPWQIPVALVYGGLLGWVYLRTRSLTLCIFGHGLNNLGSLLSPGLPFTIPGFNGEHAPGVALFQPWWFDALGLIFLVGGAFLFHRLAPPAVAPARAGEPPLLTDQPAANTN